MSVLSYREGERVHFRPLEEVLAMLEVGYLELEHVEEGSTRSFVVRKIGEVYRFSTSSAGEAPHYHVDQPQLIDLVEYCALDLHAFRWYPTLSLSDMGAYLPKSVSHVLHERINTLLDAYSAPALLLDMPKEASKCNH